nr:iron-sulfur cluster assembly scaffold protein [Sphingomonas alba]
MRLAADIPHLTPLKDPHGQAEVRSPTCGSKVSAQVILDDTGRVTDFGQQVEACAFGQASAALLGANAIGRSELEAEKALADFSGWLEGARNNPGDWPNLDVLTPAKNRRGRHGAMRLPFLALLAAIRDAEGQTP